MICVLKEENTEQIDENHSVEYSECQQPFDSVPRRPEALVGPRSWRPWAPWGTVKDGAVGSECFVFKG